MPLSPSWKQHFLQGLEPLNTIGNNNVANFTKAMAHNAAMDTKMTYLSEEHNLILVADNKKQVVILCNLKNYSGTILQPVNKVVALLGLGPNAHVVALDAATAIAAQNKYTQSMADIITADIATLRNFCPPNRRGKTNYNGLAMFIPTPFIRKAILEAVTPCPYELIQAVIAAHAAIIATWEGTEDFDEAPYLNHRNNFLMWCLAVGQESIPECRYHVLPDKEALNRHKTNAHRDYIIPTLKQAAALPANANDTVDVLRQLGATIA
jgi:hypothetical protein